MRIKKVFINSVVETLFYIIIAIVGLIKIRFIIWGLGSEINGYFQVINQFVTYIILAEAGFTGAVIYRLYKAFAEKDEKQVSKIFEGSKKIYRKISLVIIGIAILLIPFLIFVTRGSGITVSIIITFILLVFSQALSFFTSQRSYMTVLAADQKRYVFGITINSLRVISDILIIFAVIHLQNIMVVAVITLFFAIIANIIIYYIGKKRYPWLDSKHGVDMSPKKMQKDLIVHQFGNIINNNINNVIIISFLGPLIVSVFAAYNFIIVFIRELLTRNNAMITNIFGNVSAKENKEKISELFAEYNACFNFIALVVASCFILGARGFVMLWIDQPEYLLSSIIVIFFALEIFFLTLVIPINSSIEANGLFKETKYIVLLISGINLALSIILVIFIGLPGVLIATCIATVIGIILKARVLAKLLFDKQKTNRMLSYHFLVTVVLGLFIAGYYYLESYLLNLMTSYINWALIMGIVGIATVIFFFIFQYATDRAFRRLITKIKNYRWREKENA